MPIKMRTSAITNIRMFIMIAISEVPLPLRKINARIPNSIPRTERTIAIHSKNPKKGIIPTIANINARMLKNSDIQFYLKYANMLYYSKAAFVKPACNNRDFAFMDKGQLKNAPSSSVLLSKNPTYFTSNLNVPSRNSISDKELHLQNANL